MALSSHSTITTNKPFHPGVSLRLLIFKVKENIHNQNEKAAIVK
jgi:hypothetical protein